jgi:hypothetical protein
MVTTTERFYSVKIIVDDVLEIDMCICKARVVMVNEKNFNIRSSNKSCITWWMHHW